MSRAQPLMRFLRPSAVQRGITRQQPAMRFSCATRLNADAPKPSAPSTKAPNAPSSPKQASREADLAAAEAATDADSAQAPAPKPVLPSDHTTQSAPTIQTDSVSVPEGQTATPPHKAKSSKLKAQSTKTFKENKARSAPQSTTLELPPPRYHVARSKNNNYPVYQDFKRGGNLHLTTVRKITGDLSALRDELRLALNKKNEDVKINALTQHVVVKGHHKNQVTDFLKSRGM